MTKVAFLGLGRMCSGMAARLLSSGQTLAVYLGLGGSHTAKLAKALQHTASWAIDGYLIACPYYTNRPEVRLLGDSQTRQPAIP